MTIETLLLFSILNRQFRNLNRHFNDIEQSLYETWKGFHQQQIISKIGRSEIVIINVRIRSINPLCGKTIFIMHKFVVYQK